MEHPTSIAPPSTVDSIGGRRLTPYDLSYKQRQRLAAAARRYNIYDLGVKRNLEQVFGTTDRWYEWLMPWGWPCVLDSLSCEHIHALQILADSGAALRLRRPGDGQSFPIDTAKISQLRLSVEAIYAEAASDRARRDSRSGGRHDASASETESAPSDEDGPIRRA